MRQVQRAWQHAAWAVVLHFWLGQHAFAQQGGDGSSSYVTGQLNITAVVTGLADAAAAFWQANPPHDA